MRKDPDAVLDYKRDWNRRPPATPNGNPGVPGTGWLAEGETIATSTWTVPDGLTKDSESHDDTTATVWLSGGTLGANYIITNHITTSQGRSDERSLPIEIRNR